MSSELFSYDSDIKEPEKAPPKPSAKQIHVPIMPISTNQFPPFSYFYICATRATNLHNCSLQSVYLVIRTHPSLSPIVTPNAWCNDSEALFNCGYSLDFTNVPTFSLGDFTPVVELYIRYPKKSQLVGVAFLPLRILQVKNINNKPITYLYQNQPIELKDVSTLHIIGTIFITIALGEREHQTILDPNSPQFNTEPPKPAPKKKPQPKKTRRYSSDYYSDYSYSDYDYDYDEDWTVLAMKHGWVKPGSSGNWKEKALKKGWKEPSKATHYSTLVECDLDGRNNMNDNGAQTVKSIINDEIDEIVENFENAEAKFESAKNDIKSLCQNTKQKHNAHMHLEHPTQIYSSNSQLKSTKKNFAISSTIIYSSDLNQSLNANNINPLNPQKQVLAQEEEDDIELNETLMKQISVIQEKRSKTNMKVLSESSDSDDFKQINEEESGNSEIILTGSHRQSSTGSSKKSNSSQKSNSNHISPPLNSDNRDSKQASNKKDISYSSNSILNFDFQKEEESQISSKSNIKLDDKDDDRFDSSNSFSKFDKIEVKNNQKIINSTKPNQSISSNSIPNINSKKEEEDHASSQISQHSGVLSESSIIGSGRQLLPKQNNQKIIEEESYNSSRTSNIDDFMNDPILGSNSFFSEKENTEKEKPQKEKTNGNGSPLDLSLLDKLDPKSNSNSNKSDQNPTKEQVQINNQSDMSNSSENKTNKIGEPIMISNFTDDLDFKFNFSDSPPPKLKYSSTATGTMTNTENKSQNILQQNPIKEPVKSPNQEYAQITPLSQEDLKILQASSIMTNSDDDSDNSDDMF